MIPRSFPPAPGWSPGGHRIKAPPGYSRGPEKTWVYGGLRVKDGQALTLCAPSRNSVFYQDFLQLDPALTGYWQQRRRRDRLPVDPATWHPLRRQRGRCPLCRGLLLYAAREPHDEREWEQWHTVIRKAIRKEAVSAVMDLGTPGEQVAYRLIHAHCRRRISGSEPSISASPQP